MPHKIRGLRSDISKHGLRVPIVLYKGQVLEGWHRCRACCETGTEIRTEEFTGDERAALAFGLSMNLARRHLTTSDRALIARVWPRCAWGARGTKWSLYGSEKRPSISRSRRTL